MDSKKKILLGEKDILSKDNEDLFLNVNLSSTFNTIRNDKFDNVFDVERQFKKERNASRDFRIYGIVDSTVTDSDNLQIQVYTNSGATGLSNQISATTSTVLVYGGKNVFGKKRGKFIIELNDYNYDFVYLKIPSNNLNFKDQVYVQQLIFRDADGNFVEYGTQTVDINENGDAIEINNDFYFLLNKHWIKKDLEIIEEKPAKVFINSTNDSSDTNEFTTPADVVTIEVALDKPSPFGLERVDLMINTSTLDGSEITITDSSNVIITPLPYTVSFGVGEQSKLFNFYSPLDNIQEFVENVTIELGDFVNVNTGETLQHTIFVADKTPRNKVKVNFQEVYQNRNYFTGRVLETANNDFSFQMPSVLRNGLFFEGTPMEFYPSDNYVLKIKNVGANTIMPVNTKLGINSEQLFLTNEELTFDITQEYTNIEKHSIKFTFKDLNAPTSSVNYYSMDNGFKINGVPFVKYGYTFKISYNNFLAYLSKSNPPGGISKIDGWSFSSLELPFDISADATNLTITITAKSPGTRLDLSSYGIFPNLYEITTDDYDIYGIKAETIQEFVLGSQIPLVFELNANTGNNLFAQYKFTISKVGYDTMAFTCSPMAAGLVPDTYYMVSGLNTILRNWNDSTNSIVLIHDHVTSDWGSNANAFNPTYGQYKTGDVYINGMVLLANQYLSNTLYYSSNPQGSTPLNTSHAINSSGDLSHDLFPEPIAVIPETISDFSTTDVAQVGILGIARPSLPTIPTNLDRTRSFEFRTGTTGPYNLYEFDDSSSFGSDLWNYTSVFYSSGGIVGTNHTTAPALTLKKYLQDGSSTYSVTNQGLVGVAPISFADYNAYVVNNITIGGSVFASWIKLTAGTPGVPFEFKNFKEMQNTSTHSDYYNYSTMQFIEITPNQKAGVTPNLGKNFMGGFSVTHP